MGRGKKKGKKRKEKVGRERTGKEGYMDRSTCVQMRISK